ncbi:hypothetical protein LWI28_024515 [Acer negundo]|uniref:Uncharacterized protein n=1 Tax=Acer negundo TaxID=4023 RepID=A0AAD5IAS1_ACENE|nr:hypothetical protein LWI28_024515 [Acer negundo]
MLNLLMKNTNILTIIFILSTITIPPPSKANQKIPQTNCSYSIQVETTCAVSAETTDHISLRFSDSKGNLIIVKHLKNPKLIIAPKNGVKKPVGGGGFQRCSTDMFEVNGGACMEQSVCALYLKRVGSDEWRPGWVKVFHQDNGGRQVQVSYTFYFRTFVPENVWFGFDYCHSRV